jgi:hypothetical protein
MFHICWGKSLAVLIATLLFTSIGVGSSHLAHADAVTDWNAIAVQALVTAGSLRPGPVPFLDFSHRPGRCP